MRLSEKRVDPRNVHAERSGPAEASGHRKNAHQAFPCALSVADRRRAPRSCNSWARSAKTGAGGALVANHSRAGPRGASTDSSDQRKLHYRRAPNRPWPPSPLVATRSKHSARTDGRARSRLQSTTDEHSFACPLYWRSDQTLSPCVRKSTIVWITCFTPQTCATDVFAQHDSISPGVTPITRPCLGLCSVETREGTHK